MTEAGLGFVYEVGLGVVISYETQQYMAVSVNLRSF